MSASAFEAWLGKIKEPANREAIAAILDWVGTEFPQLGTVVKWNQPMFTDHGTFIIGFSAAKAHWAFHVESASLARFREEVLAAGYDPTDNITRVRWELPVDHALLRRLIEYKIEEKAGVTGFWLPGSEE